MGLVGCLYPLPLVDTMEPMATKSLGGDWYMLTAMIALGVATLLMGPKSCIQCGNCKEYTNKYEKECEHCQHDM